MFPLVSRLSSPHSSLLLGPPPFTDSGLLSSFILPPLSDRSYYRFVHLSDTHHYNLLKDFSIPPGDFLLHTGDFSNHGTQTELQTFLSQFTQLTHPYKLLIAGNHDLDSSKAWTNKPTKSLASAFRSLLLSRSSSSDVQPSNTDDFIEQFLTKYPNC